MDDVQGAAADGRGVVLSVAYSEKKKLVMKELYYSLRDEMGSDRSVGDVVKRWMVKNGEFISKHSNQFIDSKRGKAKTNSQLFVEDFLNNYAGMPLSLSSASAPRATSSATS